MSSNGVNPYAATVQPAGVDPYAQSTGVNPYATQPPSTTSTGVGHGGSSSSSSIAARSGPPLPKARAASEEEEPLIGPPCLSVAILRWNNDTKEPVLFGGKVNLEGFPKLQQAGLRQFLKMISRAVVKRARPDTRNLVEVKEYGRYRCFYFLRSTGLAAVMITQNTYRVRVAFQVIKDLLDSFDKLYPWQDKWRHCVKDMAVRCPFANDVFARAQNPARYDKLSLAQEKFDSVKIQMHKTLESVLDRGESLEDLVKRSQDLSMTTKFFYKDAKKLNKCPCIVM